MMQYPDIWDGYHHMLLCCITDYNSSSACFLFLGDAILFVPYNSFFWLMLRPTWVTAYDSLDEPPRKNTGDHHFPTIWWPEIGGVPHFHTDTHVILVTCIYITIYIFYKCYSYCCLYWLIYPKTYHHRTVGWYPDVSYLHPHEILLCHHYIYIYIHK